MMAQRRVGFAVPPRSLNIHPRLEIAHVANYRNFVFELTKRNYLDFGHILLAQLASPVNMRLHVQVHAHVVL